MIHNIEDVEQAGDIVDLLQYDEDTAGGLMGTELISVNENSPCPTVSREICIIRPRISTIYITSMLSMMTTASRGATAKEDDHAPVGVEDKARDGVRIRSA